MSLRNLFIALAIAVVGPAMADQGKPKRVALVVGNGFYKGLSSPMASVGDAFAVGRAFDKLAFTKVTIRTDLNREAFERTIREFESDAADAEWAVIYYAGGGLRVENVNYLVPVDARPAADLDVASAAIPVDRLIKAIADARALRLIILDTARGATALPKLLRASSTSLISDGLAPLPRNDDLVLYSRRHGPSPADDATRSPLAKALLDNLATPNVDLAVLLRRVQAEVSETTLRAQDAPLIGPAPLQDIFLSDQDHRTPPAGGSGSGNGGSGQPAGTGPSNDCFVFRGEKAC